MIQWFILKVAFECSGQEKHAAVPTVIFPTTTENIAMIDRKNLR
jgi:hypothetical protein